MKILLLPIFLPFFVFVCVGVFGRWVGRNGAYFLSFLGLFISLYSLLIYGIHKIWHGVVFYMYLSPWIETGIDWNFLFDQVSLEMGVLILSITCCVILYSSEYMKTDKHTIRFVILLVLFSFFMLILVSSENILQMFIGWEGVGMVSFLLINFWYLRLEANRSAIKAILFNRIGDTFFLLGLVLVLFFFKTLDISLLNSVFWVRRVYLLNFDYFVVVLDFILVCFFLAAVGKSAQLFLHAWLPDAMEGPTPVSSLLHSATMVTAGVFILIRLSPLFYFSCFVKVFVLIGGLTAFINAFFGFFQNDLKKIIAFSTCSQLGMMLVGVFYNSKLGFYHLLNHGFFKALLFLSAGSVIHALSGEQDIRKMGGLFRYLPFTTLCMLIGSLALSGFPFLSGFYSKEFILFNLYSTSSFFDLIIFMLLFCSSIFTVLYSIKIIKSVFYLSTNNYNVRVLQNVVESATFILLPMFFLSCLSLVFGFFHEEFLNNLGSFKFENVIGFVEKTTQNFIFIFFNIETSDFILKWCLILVFFIFLFFSLFHKPYKNDVNLNVYYFRNKLFLFLFWIFSNKLGFISFYRRLSVSFLILNYKIFFLLLDRGFFELFGSTKIVRVFKENNKKISKFLFVHLVDFFILIFLCFIFLFLFLFVMFSFFLFLFFLLFLFLFFIV